MGNIVITAKNKADLDLIESLVRRLGLETFELSEQEMRLLARRRLVESTAQTPIGDLSDSEIVSEVETVRAARYAREAR